MLVRVQHAHQLGVVHDPVEPLVDRRQDARVLRLEAEEQIEAAAANHQVQQLRVLEEIDRRQPAPLLAKRDHRREELARVLRVVDEAHVVERHVACPGRSDVPNDVRHRATHVRLPHRRHRAEVAGAPAAAGGLQCVGDHVAGPAVEVPARGGYIWQGRLLRFRLAVHPSQAAAPEVLQDRRPRRLRVAEDDRVGVRDGLSRQVRHVDATEHDGRAPAPVVVGEGVSLVGAAGQDADPDEVRRVVERQVVHASVRQPKPDPGVRRHERGQGRERERHFPERLPERPDAQDMHVGVRHHHQDAHDASSASGLTPY